MASTKNTKPEIRDYPAMKSHITIMLLAVALLTSACSVISPEEPVAAAESGQIPADQAIAALPGYGAIAFSETSQRWRFRWNVLEQERANALAMNDCGDSGCQILLTFGPKQCGTFALGAGNLTAAAVGSSREQAEKLAREKCFARTEECLVAPAQCNA